MQKNSPCGLAVLALAAAGVAQDWNAYHGPNGNRRVAVEIGLTDWPDGGPPVVWRTKVKDGFSSLCVAGGRVFTLVRRDGAEACIALDQKNGKELWAATLDAPEFDRGGDSGARGNRGGDGPRSTPTYDGGCVYVFDASLVLYCFDAASGESVWTHDLVGEYGGRNIRWQSAASPVIDGKAVFVAGGGDGESLLAFDKKGGKLLWTAQTEKITHATPVVATIQGVRQVIFFVQAGLVAVRADTGELIWRARYPYRVSTAASPVVYEDIVYCSAGYGVGGAAFHIVKSDDGVEAKLLWREPNKRINHWSTPVVKDGFLYGMFSFKKYGKGPMKCVDIRTGEVRWSEPGFGPGNCIAVGGHIVALSDKGEACLIDAKPDAYTELARADVLDGKCWSSPAFAHGQLYVRSTREAVRIDLSGKKQD